MVRPGRGPYPRIRDQVPEDSKARGLRLHGDALLSSRLQSRRYREAHRADLGSADLMPKGKGWGARDNVKSFDFGCEASVSPVIRKNNLNYFIVYSAQRSSPADGGKRKSFKGS